MRTISVQQMPNGFEVETPSFWAWMKAGMAFTLGAGIISVTAVVLWQVLAWGFIFALFSHGHR